jgi:hypothetical protein
VSSFVSYGTSNREHPTNCLAAEYAASTGKVAWRAGGPGMDRLLMGQAGEANRTGEGIPVEAGFRMQNPRLPQD